MAALPGTSRLKNRDDTRFMSDLRAATLHDATPLAGLSLWLLAAVLFAAWYWADHASLDIVTRGQGEVIPSSHEQVIQSLEGGILAELLVQEGDTVDKGQVLLRIDDTKFGASFREGRTQQQALKASIARLRAEAQGTELVFPPDLPAELVRSETALYQSRVRALDEAVDSTRHSLDLVQKELNLTAPLVSKGVVSEVEVLRLKRQVVDLRGKVQDRINTFRTDARGDLQDKEARLAGISEANTARADQVRRTVIRSPVRGIVKNIRVTTVGGVIQPGQHIMEIVPLEDQLLIEARIRPSDVAFLRPGLPATVKITAYDYSIYGGLKGVLEQISADTIVDEHNPRESFYRVTVRTDKSHLEGKSGPLPIIPGMTAKVEVLTGHKTVLDYILKPVVKVRESALHER